MRNKLKIHPIYRTLNVLKLCIVIALFVNIMSLSSCEDFVEVDPPNNQLTGEVIFEDVATVDAAVAHIYSQLRDNVLTTASTLGLPYLLGHYADELTLYSNFAMDVQLFFENNLVASNNSVLNIWNTSYNLIYATNSIIEGVQNSSSLTDDEKNQFLGEAHFLRAFIHFHLTNLYGEIPYIETTDYIQNNQVSKLSEDVVYQKISTDLILSKSLLSMDYIGDSKVRPNKWVATALLARVYLYEQNWELALNQATEIISDGGYILNTDINQVFLKNSTETLWQYSSGKAGSNTIDAFTYIFTSGPPPNSALSSYLVNSFEMGDTRFTNWVGLVSDGTDTWYYPFKYKLNSNTGTTQECSIVFRLAEIYLIAAEANAQLGNTSAALSQLNVIRERANLAPITESGTLVDTILQERRIEFFTEQAHRFFDLKRTGKANIELPLVKNNWNDTDILLPLPQKELTLNPNIQPQNDGY